LFLGPPGIGGLNAPVVSRIAEQTEVDGAVDGATLAGRRSGAEPTLPPGPPLPLPLGSLITWTATLPFWEACRRRYGPVFTVRCFPWGTAVFVGDADLVKTIFTGDPAVFHAGDGNALLGPIVGERSLLLADEDDHLRARRRILPPLHGGMVREYEGEIERIALAEIRDWPIGEPFALHPRLTAMTVAVVLRVVMGMREGERAARLRTLIPASADWDPSILAGWAMPRLARFGRWRRHGETVAEARELLLAEIVERRDAGPTGGTDVLSHMLADGEADDEEIRDDLMSVLVAGEGTSAVGLAWAFERLLRHPEALERAKDGDDDYLEAVLRETLRVRPVLPAVVRRLQEPTEVGDWLLPAGATVAVTGWLLHSDPRLYPDPTSFRPERFLGDPGSLTYTWIPFGGGRRRCPGAPLALVQMKTILRTILQNVTLHADRERPEGIRHRNVTLAPARGARVVRTA
jgi:cytochrome P450